MTYDWRTSPTTIKVQITQFVTAMRHHLGDNLLGIYLHGSLAMGCFNPASSDIDLLIVTEEGMSVATKRALVVVILGLSGQPTPLEMSFVSQQNLHPWRYPTPFDLHYSETWRKKFQNELASDTWQHWNDQTATDADLAAHITVIQQRGVCLWGELAAQALPVVPRWDYIASCLADLAWGNEQLLENPAYSVLNHCRTYAYLCDGRVRSKAEGGAWALAQLAPVYHPLIRQALAVYQQNDMTVVWQEEALRQFLQDLMQQMRFSVIG